MYQNRTLKVSAGKVSTTFFAAAAVAVGCGFSCVCFSLVLVVCREREKEKEEEEVEIGGKFSHENLSKFMHK